MRTRLWLILLPCLALASVAPAMNKESPYPPSDPTLTNELPRQLKDVGIDQNLGAQVPLDLVFRDEAGKPVRLGDLMGGHKPILLTLVYYSCPMLCTVVLNDTLRTLRLMDLSVGKDFTVLTVSFDPRETAELAGKKKRTYLNQYKRDGADAGWHFLTGDAEAIRALTDTVGFRYQWDEKSQQFMHAGGVMILTPQGRVSRYFYGIEYAPKDVTLALVQASDSRVGSLTDQILLFCFHYDPSSGRYTLAITRALKIGATLLIASLGVLLFVLSRNDSRRGAPPAPAAPNPRQD